MKTIARGITGFVAGIALLAAPAIALAQAYTYSGTYTPPSSYYSLYSYGSYSGGCVNLTRDLSAGSQGSDVSSLQTFLISRNYPGSGSWMQTGYFGNATQAAVRNFQSAQGLAVTGYVDAPTRSAIASVSCGYPMNYGTNYNNSSPYTYNNNYNYSYQYPYQYQTPYQNQYPYNNGYQYCNGVYTYNSNCQSGNYYGGGTYYGGTYFDNTCNNWYGCQQNNYGAPTITYLSPTSGAVGASVTVFGSGFSTTGNTVHFGNGIITNLLSTDGHSVSFTVPSALSGYGSQLVYLGSYNVSVTNNSGFTSNAMPFSVTSLGSSAAPLITNVTGPTNLNIGAQGTWSLTVNNQSGSYLSASVQWGDPVYGAYAMAPQQILGGGVQSLTFTHTYAQAGTYTAVFTVTNNSGQSNTSSITVNVSGNGTGTGSAYISSITPLQGPVGTQIIIQGSGFSAFDNTVHFGNGGLRHVPAINGTTIYYTIPQYLSPCDVLEQGSVCALYLQVVQPGSYPVSISNGSATSNTVNYTVQ